MIVSEEEAKTKVCPASVSINGTGYCLASLCMAWKWEHKKVQADDRTKPKYVKTGKGACGLVGKL